jgi:hypothetical protein
MSRSFIFQLNICGYSPYVTSSLTRGWVCRLQLLLVLASVVILRSESHGTHDHILLSQIRDSPNLDGQATVFISPRNRVARLRPQAPGSLFFASYDSQDYSRGIRSCLHTRFDAPSFNIDECAPFINAWDHNRDHRLQVLHSNLRECVVSKTVYLLPSNRFVF